MMKANSGKTVHPWAWIPTLYFIQGLPNVTVATVAVILYKRLGVPNAELAFYTGWLYLPWVLKPLWSPFVDMFSTKRQWTVVMQLLMAVTLAGVAFLLPTSFFFSATLAVFWLLAFTSATHDIASDGFYILSLTEHQQSYFVGVRSTFYRCATLFVQGAIVVLAGILEYANCPEGTEPTRGQVIDAWMLAFLLLGVIMLVASIYHNYILPTPTSDRSREVKSVGQVFREFGTIFASFFRKPGIVIALIFMLLYRLPEAQLVKLINPFLLDPVSEGGLGLTTTQVGVVYGTVGVFGIIFGGILGGILASIYGLKRCIRPMAWAMSLTCLTFVMLSQVANPPIWLVATGVCVEQLGYGFGFSAYMLYLLYFAQGKYSTAHYAICTAFMSIGLMLPGMVAGWIQEHLGYPNFFLWTMGCCVATIGVAYMVKVDPSFGKKKE